MRVLRPKVVCTGCTDRQLLLSPQSPHPSQTRSLMTTRNDGVAIRSRLRSRRFSAAQRWSWISTVQPGTVANSCCASISRSQADTANAAAGRAGCAGQVRAVRCAAGQVVERGQLLVELQAL